MIGYYNTVSIGWYIDDCDRMMAKAASLKSFREFLKRRSEKLLYNPLPILSKALNIHRLPITIKIPRWSSLRWRSTT